MLVKTFSSSLFGIDATTITIEVNLGIGVNFYLVGLPDSAVKESQQRIRAAFQNNGLKFPIKVAIAVIRKMPFARNASHAVNCNHLSRMKPALPIQRRR